MEQFIRREFVTPRFVARESATQVHAAMASVRIRYYSRREREGMSERSFPGVRSRRPGGRHGRDRSWRTRSG